MKTTPRSSRRRELPGFPRAQAWEKTWQQHWSKAGLPGYELPPSEDGDFLTQARTVDKERARLERITREFVRGFKGLLRVGPAVTVFGSARFRETHPYYKLARATGAELARAELARAGFATLTGGGLGTLDELFEAATLIQCRKIGPFPLILMGSKFWSGLREWGQDMMRAGVFARDEIGFGYVTDSPREAVDLIVRSLPPPVRARLKPLA